MAEEDMKNNDEEATENYYTKQETKSYMYLKWSFYCFIVIMSTPYALTSAQYSEPHRSNSQHWMSQFFNFFANDNKYFDHPEAIFQQQFNFYQQHLWSISLHTMAGTGWFLFGFIQLNSYIRNNYILIHRISGYCYFICLTISLIGSGSLIIYQILEGEQSIWTQNGAYNLFATIYWLAGVITGCGGLYAIKKKQIARHKQWMPFNFALAVAAAWLRFLWVIFSYLYPSKNMDEINLICFQLIVICGVIPTIYVTSIGDINNERGFKRFLIIDTFTKRKIFHAFVLGFITLLNLFFMLVIANIEYVFGSVSWYEWLGYDTSKHSGGSSVGLKIFYIFWLVTTFVNIYFWYCYRFIFIFTGDGNKCTYKYFNKCFIFVSICNLMCIIITLVNINNFEGIYVGIKTRKEFANNAQWFWIIGVCWLSITNVNCLYYFYYKKDIERCYEWMTWMVLFSGFNFIIRYSFVFLIFNIFNAFYDHPSENTLQDLIASGHATFLEFVFA
eukprot:99365_1